MVISGKGDHTVALALSISLFWVNLATLFNLITNPITMAKKLTLLILSLISFFTVTAQPVPELMWYRFRESGTSVLNEASSPVGSASATIMGGVTQGGTTLCDGGLIGSGVSSTTDYLNTGWAPNVGAGAWTISVRTSGISTSATLFYIFGDVNTNALRCFTNGIAGSTNWVIRGGGLTDLYINGGALATPTMITFVYDPTLANLKGYLNGVLVSTVAQGAVNLTGSGPFKVMGYSANVGAPAGGVLDDFRFYNRALSDSEVMQIYNPYATPGFLGADDVICGGSPFELQLNPTDGVYGDWSTGDLGVDSVIVSSGGTYTVDVSGVCGDGNDTIVLGEIPTLAAGFLGADPSFCVGDSLWTGIAVPMDSVLWSTGETTDSISISTAGTYEVTAYNACGTYMDTINASPASPLSAGFLGGDMSLCVGDTAIAMVGSPVDSALWSTGDTTDAIYITSVGTYSVSATNACGTFADTLDVTASALVYTGFITADSGMHCVGDTVMITADPGYTTYMWSTGDTSSSIWVLASGTYTCTVTDACGSGSESASVVLSTAPVAGFSFSTTSGGTADFTDGTTGGGPYTYAWDFGDGGSSTLASPSHTYATDGVYMVTLIVSNACGSDTISDTVNIVIIGMSDAISQSTEIYPNPAQDVVNISCNLLHATQLVITVESALGQEVLKEEISSVNGQFKTSMGVKDLPAGIYLVRLTSGANTAVSRLVISR